MDPASRYLRIRHQHLVHSLHDLSRRNQGTVLAAGAFLGPFFIGFGQPIVRGLAAQRAETLAAWALLTTLLVLALREAVFMLRARDFLSSLPLTGMGHFLADLRSVATVQAMPLLLLVWAMVESPSIGAAFRLGVFGVACIALQSLLPRAFRRTQREGSRVPGAVTSALALPVLLDEARAATAMRLFAVAAVLAAGHLFTTLEGQCPKAWGFFLVQAVLCAWVMHRIPALVDERTQAALPFLFRLPRARMRSVGFAAAAMLTAFIAADAIAAYSWQQACAAPSPARAVVGSVAMAVALCAVALASLRYKVASGWASFIALAAAALLTGNVA